MSWRLTDRVLDLCLPGDQERGVRESPGAPASEFYRYSQHAKEVEAARQRWERVKRRLRPLVFARDAFTCQVCGLVGEPQRFTQDPQQFQGLVGIGLVVDHVVALSAGGSDELTNLQTLCWTCNSRKAAAEGRARQALKRALGYSR